MKKKLILCLISVLTLQITACGSEPIKDTVVIDNTQYENDTKETIQETKPEETPAATTVTSEKETESSEVKAYEPEFTFTSIDNKTMWAIDMQAVYSEPTADSDITYFLQKNESITVIGQCNENLWYKVQCPNTIGYISNAFLTDIDPTPVVEPTKEPEPVQTPEPIVPTQTPMPVETLPQQTVAPVQTKESFSKSLYEPISYDSNSLYWYYIIGEESSDKQSQAKTKAQTDLNAQSYMYFESRGICEIGEYEQGTVGIWLAETFSNASDYNTNKSGRENFIKNNISNYK